MGGISSVVVKQPNNLLFNGQTATTVAGMMNYTTANFYNSKTSNVNVMIQGEFGNALTALQQAQ
jgi:hypothetical protein